MNNILATITADSGDLINRKVTQALSVVSFISDATGEVGTMIDCIQVNDAMWLLSDLLNAVNEEISKRQYVRGGNNERI